MSLGDRLARAIAAVRVNIVERDGARWIKRRRRGMTPVIVLGNVYLSMSRSRIRMFPSCAAWQAWEVAAMRALHGDAAASCEPRRAIATRELPGISLRGYLDRGGLTPAMLSATGRELARAHGVSIGGRAFSHGDLHMRNVIYDAATGRAQLLDIETRHDSALGPRDRHADDLLVLALDLLGGAPGDTWLVLVTALLDGYRRRDVIEAFAGRLVVPRGFERVLWATRTHFLPDRVLAARLAALNSAVAAQAVRARPLRHRPSRRRSPQST